MTITINRALLTKRQSKLIDKNNGITPGWMQKLVAKKIQDKKRLTEPGANFRVGQQKVYLPNFTIMLLRTPMLPPTHAKFQVPLHFTKLDLRDYLFHAYSVRVHSVTSSVQGPKISPKIRNPDPSSLKKMNSRQKKLQRVIDFWMSEGKVKKLMTVHLEQPFVWPPKPTPEDLNRIAGMQSMFHDKDRPKTAEKKREKDDEKLQETMASLADKLRLGEERWHDSSAQDSSTIESEHEVADGTGFEAQRIPEPLHQLSSGKRDSGKANHKRSSTTKGSSLQSSFSAERRRPDF